MTRWIASASWHGQQNLGQLPQRLLAAAHRPPPNAGKTTPAHRILALSKGGLSDSEQDVLPSLPPVRRR